MENIVVSGILNIVEDKLREFSIQIPDEDREDSQDPIVGYHYAELHDRIFEFLNENGQLQPVKLHGISIVNSEGFLGGNESYVELHRSYDSCVSYAFHKYCCLMDGYDDSSQKLTQKEFTRILERDGLVSVGFDNSHLQIEYFCREV